MSEFDNKPLFGKELKKYKKTLSLTNIQREIIVGLLLGDGHLETRNNGITYRLKIGQSIDHKIYVDHLFDIFKEFCGASPRIYTNPNSNYTYIQFSTYSHISFKFYGQQFYSDKVKIVPKLIHKWLTPRSLAYWYMDDGSRKSNATKSVYLNTQGFTYSEVKILNKILQDKFDLITKIKLDKSVSENSIKLGKGYRIFISSYSYEQLSNYIKPYLTSDMLYKFP